MYSHFTDRKTFHSVAGTVDGALAERVGYEALSREVRGMQVPERDSYPTNTEFTLLFVPS